MRTHERGKWNTKRLFLPKVTDINNFPILLYKKRKPAPPRNPEYLPPVLFVDEDIDGEVMQFITFLNHHFEKPHFYYGKNGIPFLSSVPLPKKPMRNPVLKVIYNKDKKDKIKFLKTHSSKVIKLKF